MSRYARSNHIPIVPILAGIFLLIVLAFVMADGK